MIQTLEAIIDQNGNVHLIEKVKLPASRRAIVSILEEDPAVAVSEAALLSDRLRKIG